MVDWQNGDNNEMEVDAEDCWPGNMAILSRLAESDRFNSRFEDKDDEEVAPVELDVVDR